MRASETILRDLERDISTGALVPGDTIDETSLAKRFDISRTPAREACTTSHIPPATSFSHMRHSSTQDKTTGETAG